MSKPLTKSATVYKSNALVEASYRLTVAEGRIILACIAQVRHDELVTDEVMYSVSAAELADLTGTATKDAYHDLKRAVDKLFDRRVTIVKEPNGGGRQRKPVTRWVQTVDYIEAEGRVELRFSKDILPYLTALKSHFTRYKLAAVARMDSAYAVRLYELLVQWREAGEREVEIEWLRQAFVLGDKYPSIKDLKKRVLDPAIAQINEHSDLQVTWTQRKTGRRVTHLTFRFSDKKAKNGSAKKTRRGVQETGERINGVLKVLVDALARPGETYDQAASRLKQAGILDQVRPGESYADAAARLRREGIKGGL